MRKENNGLVMICLLFCICVGLTGYVVQTQLVYDQRDVAVINRLIAENNLDIPKNAPQKWTKILDIRWSAEYPKRIEWLWFCVGKPIDTADLSDLQQLQSLSWRVKTDTLILPEHVEEVDCTFTPLKRLDCSKAKHLKVIRCEGSQLSELDVSALKELEELTVNDNQLIRLIVQNLPKLHTLHCGGNQLTELNLQNLPALEVLDCSDNRLKQLHVTNMPKLSFLWCYGNQLQELDITGLYNLTSLRCEDNQLKQLVARDLPNLECLICNYNPLEELQLENLPALHSLDCGFRGRLYLNETMQLTAFDYATRTVEVAVQPPVGKYLSSCEGLPGDVQIDGNIMRFTLTYQAVSPEPVYLSEDIRP